MSSGSVAVVGMACVFPGARDLDAYWENLVRGVDAVGKIPPDRWPGSRNRDVPSDHDAYIGCRRGGFIETPYLFDPLRHRVMPNVAAHGDPDQFILLDIIDDALNDAGIDRSDVLRQRTDLIVGRGGYTSNKMLEIFLRADGFERMLAFLADRLPDLDREALDQLAVALRETLPPEDVDGMATSIPNLVPSRTANRLDLQGAAYTVDAACASSLIAVEDALLRLRQGSCDVAIAAGINFTHVPSFWFLFSRILAISQSENIRPFDRRADGMLLGEGAGAVVLKRAEDARAHGDRVYALIKGVGSASDGAASGVLAPASRGQVLALERAYRDAGVDPGSIGFLEAHGTATPAGDQAEIETVKRFYGPPLTAYPHRIIGSVKSMIGHTMPAAGMASLIKSALALSNKIIPPSLHCEQPLPELAATAFYLSGETRPWLHPPGTPRRAGVNAFGFGGINAHMVMEEVPSPVRRRSLPVSGNGAGGASLKPRPIRTGVRRPSELLVFSAPDQGGLASRFIEVARMLEDKGARIRLEDLAWTLAGTAEVVAGCRFARVSDSLEGLAGELRDLADCAERGELGRRNGEGVFFGDGGNGTTGRVAAVFPGLGFPGLVGEFPRHLLANCLYFPCVREVFDHLERRDGHPEDAIPTGFLLVPPAHLPQEVRARLQGRFAPVLTALGGMATSSQVAPDERNLSQMGMLANNHASWCVLQGLGIPVDMLCGQSLGDFSAVLAAGMVDFEESIPRFWEVFNLDIPYSDSGLIAMVGTTEDSLSPFLEAWPAVSIGIHLSPTTLVVGGPEEDVRGFCGQLREKEILAQTLPFPAIHTPQLGKAEQLLARAVGKKYRLKKSKITIYSGALAAPMPSNPKAVEDLFRKNLSRPVRFWQTVHRMYEDGARFVVQIGSGTLAAASQSVLDKDDAVFTAMDVSHRDPLTQLQHMCGEFFAAGVGIERAGLFAGRAPRDVLANEPDGDGSARSSTVPLTLYWPPMYHYERPEEVRAPVSPQPGSRPESVGVFPFVDLITDHQPGVSIGVASKITLAEHLYLADHTFSNANGLKPLRECFPVLPLTMTLELMAEVGACLAPGRGLVAFEDIRAHRWIAFEEVDTVNLHSEGEVLEEDDDRVVVRVSVSREGETVAQGRVIFSDHYRETLKLGFSDLSHPRPFPMDAAEVYDTKFLFHGPRFHCLSTIGMRGDQGILGELTVLDRNRLFASGEDPQLLTDPVTLDGPGQLVGIFFERNETLVLPVGVDRIEFYRPPPAPGTKVPVRVEFSEFDLEARRTSAFVEVQDGQGGVWFRMEGWRDLVFSWSLAVLRNMGEPGKYTLAEAHAFAGLPEDAVGVHLRHETIREVRLDWLARNYLTSREWERFRSMDNVFQRQRDWLMGRVAAKDAVRLWMSRRTGSGEFAHPAAIELENDASGKVSVLALAGFPKRPCISLSHGKAGAVAVASAHSVGIDAEPNEAAEALAKEDFTTPGELRRLNRIGVPPDAETSWLTRLWCAKEATAKFLGTGLEGRPRGFETVEVSSEGDLTVMHNESGRQVKVSISGFEGIVVAVATEPDLFVADGLPRYLEK